MIIVDEEIKKKLIKGKERKRKEIDCDTFLNVLIDQPITITQYSIGQK